MLVAMTESRVTARVTPNQVVAFNLRAARLLLGLTQEQAAERLEPYLGERWSKRVFSAAERSFVGERVRQFTVDDLIAFAAAFDFPVSFFLAAPPRPYFQATVAARNAEKDVAPDYLEELVAGSQRLERRVDDLRERRYAEDTRRLAELGIGPPPPNREEDQ
jgi:transcriptional regulator with XRE-family HTH domain